MSTNKYPKLELHTCYKWGFAVIMPFAIPAIPGNSWHHFVTTQVSKLLLRSLQPREYQKEKGKKRNTPNFTCMSCTCSDTPYICHISVCMLLSRDTSETATKVTRMVINSSQGKHTTRKTMRFLRLYFRSPSYSLFGY